MYRIVFTRDALKTLLKLPGDISMLIRRKLGQLADDPYADHLDVKKLHNRSGYRLRIGDRRVIYEICGSELRILIVKIGTRGDIYR